MGWSWHGRLFGTSPSSISKSLDYFGVPYVEASSASELSSMLSNGGMAILKKWNATIQYYDFVIGYGQIPTYKTPVYLGGHHVMLIVHNADGVYTVYNRYSNSLEIHHYDNFETLIGSGEAYIAGFYIG